MRVLLVKTSSMGDVIHTLPALTDAVRALGDVRFDWVVEEAFAEIPRWHPAVDRVIPVALRRWRREPLSRRTREGLRAYRAAVRERCYACVIDAQGLLKSAALTRLAPGPRCGPDWSSAREPLASLFYERRVHVPREEHAIERTRRLFALALGYDCPRGEPDYGIQVPGRSEPAGGEHDQRPYLVFLHGTTWATKLWPEEYWCALARLAAQTGFHVYLPTGGASDQDRAARIAAGNADVTVLPRQGLGPVAALLAGACGVVGVDTGLSHLAAALGVPAVTIYGATRPALTGTRGRGQAHAVAELACAPCMRRECRYTGASEVRPACYRSVPPPRVWALLRAGMASRQQQQGSHCR